MNLNELALIKDIDHYKKTWNGNLRAIILQEFPNFHQCLSCSSNYFLESMGLTTSAQLSGSLSLAPEL